MEIKGNYIQNYLSGAVTKTPDKSGVTPSEENGKKTLPAVDTNGMSAVNASVPVSYTKISEISVPGVNKKADVYKLANGQKVVILPKKGPVCIKTSFNVGSLNEPDEIRGISHCIEHNLFNGSKDLAPGEFDKNIKKSGGYSNAYTTFGETQYYLSLQLLDENSFEDALKNHANMVQYPNFPEDALEREKEPVKSEIDRCADDVSNRAYSTVLKNMFDIKSDSDDIVIGNKDNINNLTTDKLRDYYNTWYTPDNCVTVISGDVNPSEAINLVSKYFNKQTDYSKINQRKFEPLIPVNKPSRVDITQKNDPDTTIVLGFPLPGGTSLAQRAELNILFDYIFSSNSQISKALDKYGVDLKFDIEDLSSDPCASKVISASLSLPEEHVEDVIKIINDGLVELANNPPSEQDVNLCKDSALYKLKQNERNEDISSDLVRIARTNNFNYYEETKQGISSVTPLSLSQAAKNYLDLNKISMCVAHSESSDKQNVSQNTAGNVSFGSSFNPQDNISSVINKSENYKLSNNSDLTLVSSDGSDKCSFDIDFEAPFNKDVSQAAACVLNEILNRGSFYKNNSDYENLMNASNSQVQFQADSNSLKIKGTINPEKINDVSGLIKETLIAPRFTQDEFERAKQIIKESITAQTPDPEDKIKSFLYSDDKFFADKEEQLKCLDNLTLDDVKKLFEGIMSSAQSRMVFAVNENYKNSVRNSIVSNFSQGIGVFKEFVPDMYSNISVYKPNTQEKVIVDTQENAQAHIVRSYQYKDTGNVEDYAKILILNTILGGGMSSRLFEDIRNNEKIAYHVSSYVDKHLDSGSINLKVETSTDDSVTKEASSANITKALAAFKRNTDKLKSEPVSDEELQSAKNICKTNILNSLESGEDISSLVSADKNTKYGLNHTSELFKAIDSITADDVKACANYVFENAPVTSIVAGKKTLEELNLK